LTGYADTKAVLPMRRGHCVGRDGALGTGGFREGVRHYELYKEKRTKHVKKTEMVKFGAHSFYLDLSHIELTPWLE
jgi:hypothetical protein